MNHADEKKCCQDENQNIETNDSSSGTRETRVPEARHECHDDDSCCGKGDGSCRDESNSDSQTIEDGLVSLEAERDKYRDMAQRIQAEFENYKKRVAKADIEKSQRASESLAIKLLPVLDACELAIGHSDPDSVNAIAAQLLEILGKAGLTKLGAPGEAFDPHFHEAVMHEDGVGDPIIVDVMRTGYSWNGKVIRAAMVKVQGS